MLFVSQRLRVCAKRVCAAAAIILLAAAAPAQTPNAVSADELELRYADGLRRLGLPDYAKMVLDGLSRGPKAELMRLQIALSKGEFDQGKAVIAAKPNQDSEEVWEMKLALGDALYAWGKYPEAKAVYNSFFQRYSASLPAKMAESYINAAYKFGQMLVLIGQTNAGLDMYKKALSAAKDQGVQRQLRAEIAELMLKIAEEDPSLRARYAADAEKICDDLLWQQDLWFGKAVVMKAHVRMLRGDLDGAMDLVEDYMPILVSIHKQLEKEARQQNSDDLIRMSPLPECRYLMGAVLQKEAQKLFDAGGDKAKIGGLLLGRTDPKGRKQSGAAQHFVNVYVRYPMTPWSPDAGVRLEQVREMVRKIGREFDYRITPEQREEIERQQFQGAKVLYNQGRWQEAADAYLKVLNLSPEGRAALAGLADLCRCYIELGNDLYTDLVLRYLAERFSGRAAYVGPAGNHVLSLYQTFIEHKMPEKAQETQALFVKNFTHHPRAVNLLFRSAEQKLAAKDYAGAMTIYQQVTNQFASAPLAADAMNRIASCYQGLGDRESEIATLADYIKTLEARSFPGPHVITARYRLATAYREMGDKYLPTAMNQCIELISLLSGNSSKYSKSTEDVARNEKILQAAMYYRALGYAKLPPPAGKPENEYKLRAVKAFEELIAQRPKSDYVPAALGHLGALWTVLQDPEEANKALQRLQKDFPDSPEAKNAKFNLARSLLEQGRRREAVAAFKEMFGDRGGQYSDTQILMAGSELLKAKEHETAVEAFDRVLSSSKDRTLREPAMAGKGQALIELGRNAEGIKALEALLSEYRNSGYTVEACLALAKAYSLLGEQEPDEIKRANLFNGGIRAIKKARRYLEQLKDKRGMAESDLRVARIYERLASASEKYSSPAAAAEYRGKAAATYQIMIMGAAAADPELKPFVEKAYAEGIPLLMQLEAWEQAKENCEQYLQIFPDGPNVSAVRTWLSRIEGKLATQAPPPRADGQNAGGASP